MLEIPFGSANLVFLRLWLRFTVSGIKKVVGDGDVIEVNGTLRSGKEIMQTQRACRKP